MRRALISLALAALAACSETETTADPADAFPKPKSQWRQVIPSPDLPSAVTTDVSNNNLDVALFQGQLYVAFRTAPTHFASDQVLLHVVRAADPWKLGQADAKIDWVHELTLDMDRDLREPRLFVLGDKLYLYYALLGAELTSFDPGGTMAVVRDAGGEWSAPVTVFDEGIIVWRTKTLGGKVYMTAYSGGENIYQGRADNEALDLYFLTTDDGLTWHGVDPNQPVVMRGGISETDFEFDDAGDLYAVSRNETGDASGFGSRLCKAPAGAPAQWTCLPKSDPHKYDSPYMFKYGPFLYLIARYNPGGPFDQFGGQPATVEHWWINEYRYSTSPKHTALYGYDTQNMRIVPLEIFPSNGDTAFAGGVWLDDKHHLVLNYSSDPNLPQMSWLEGQFLGSQIYAAILEFE